MGEVLGKRWRQLLAALLLFGALGAGPWAARPSPRRRNTACPRKAVEIARPFGFPITNSMVVSWIVALGLIVFAQVATRNMKQVPGGAQNFLEWLVEGLYGFLEGIIGRHLVKRTFWFFATIFIFILSANWVGLIPGVGHDRVGTSRPPTASRSTSRCSAGPTPIST